MRGAHRKAIAEVDLINDTYMLLVGAVELCGGHPLVAGKDCSRLQHSKDFTIHLFKLQTLPEAPQITPSFDRWHTSDFPLMTGLIGHKQLLPCCPLCEC